MSHLSDFLVNHEADLEWLENTMCADMDISDFFVEAGHTISQDVINICRMCPVRAECVTHAYRNSITGGYFGGISPGQRRELSLDDALAHIAKDVHIRRETRPKRSRGKTSEPGTP